MMERRRTEKTKYEGYLAPALGVRAPEKFNYAPALCVRMSASRAGAINFEAQKVISQIVKLPNRNYPRRRRGAARRGTSVQ